mmetsp:Transcript_33866/g.78123  ORF Transcript_33866/g.78123 Transcript_33866/m.78123 type:complete len:203 (-) Transcript_33866:1554-2162(-)
MRSKKRIQDTRELPWPWHRWHTLYGPSFSVSIPMIPSGPIAIASYSPWDMHQCSSTPFCISPESVRLPAITLLVTVSQSPWRTSRVSANSILVVRVIPNIIGLPVWRRRPVLLEMESPQVWAWRLPPSGLVPPTTSQGSKYLISTCMPWPETVATKRVSKPRQRLLPDISSLITCVGCGTTTTSPSRATPTGPSRRMSQHVL